MIGRIRSCGSSEHLVVPKRRALRVPARVGWVEVYMTTSSGEVSVSGSSEVSVCEYAWRGR